MATERGAQGQVLAACEPRYPKAHRDNAQCGRDKDGRGDTLRCDPVMLSEDVNIAGHGKGCSRDDDSGLIGVHLEQNKTRKGDKRRM